MSLIRVGLSETEDFAKGYDAIFGKKADKKSNEKEEAKPAPAPKPEEAKEPVENPFRKGQGIGC